MSIHLHPLVTRDSSHDQLTKLTVSYSQIADWLACRWRWLARYPLHFRASLTPENLIVGDTLHVVIARYLAHEMATVDEALDYELNQIRGLIADELLDDEGILGFVESLRQNVGYAANSLVEHIQELGWKTEMLGMSGIENPVPAVELEFRLTDGIPAPFEYFTARVDWLARDQENRVWLVDFKTRKQFSPNDREEVNLQHLIYAAICTKHGIRIDGTVTFEVKSVAPAKPTQNKDGSMSRAAIATDWPTYRQALVDAGLNPFYYEDMKEKLARNRPTNVVSSFRSPILLENVWNSLVQPAIHEMADALLELQDGGFPDRIYREMQSFNCNGCLARGVCLADLHGYDTAPYFPLNIHDRLFDPIEVLSRQQLARQ